MKLGNPIVSGFRPETLTANKKGGVSSYTLAKQIRQETATALQEQGKKLAEQIHKSVLSKPKGESGKAAEAAERAKVEKEQRRRQYERELRACRTKKDVEAVKARWRSMYMAEMGAINKSNLPPDEKTAKLKEAAERYAEKEEVATEFMGSADYKKLPDEEKEEEKRKKAIHDLTKSLLDKEATKQSAKVEDAKKGTADAARETATDPIQTQGQQAGAEPSALYTAKPATGQEGGQPESESQEQLGKSDAKINVYA